jgi:Zn-finger nucleic acid-binding protein
MAAVEPRSARTEPLRCPNDGARLVEIERSEVLIDACPECRGVWLDRGELDKILSKERAASSGDPDQDFFNEVEGKRRRPHDDDQRYPDERRHRRRSILEELLDFG